MNRVYHPLLALIASATDRELDRTPNRLAVLEQGLPLLVGGVDLLRQAGAEDLVLVLQILAEV